MDKQQLLISVDAEKLADWIEKIAHLAYDSPKVTVQSVAKNPADAMYGAIQDMQERLQSLTSDMAWNFKGNRDCWSWLDIVKDLRQES
jgi:hypothetical protein